MTTTPTNNLTLAILRLVQGWNQRELADATGLPASLISNYERGRKTLSRDRLERMGRAMGVTPRMTGAALSLVESLRAASRAGGQLDAEAERIEATASELGRMVSDVARKLLESLRTKARALEDREEAAVLWARLKRLTPAHRLMIVSKAQAYRSWALCELICEQSVKAAGDDADRAVELAGLALKVAELTPGDEAWRSRLQGYAWAHAGNARRVRGNLPQAEEAFARSRQLWQAGASTDLGLLEEARVLDLEASLRRDQTRFKEALELLDRALATEGSLTKRLLLNKATVLEALGDFSGAVAALRQAAPLVELEGEPRFLFALRFNLAVNYWFLGRYREAEGLLSELRALTVSLGNGLDGLRFRWLEGRIAAGLGKRAEAIEILSGVREEFVDRGIANDTALASLELTVLYLEEGRTAEVKILVRQMAPIFRTQGVHREALAALQLFREAVEHDAQTLDLARRLVTYFQRAQYNPELRFEDA